MGLRKVLQLLIHGDRRLVPRTPEALKAVRRKQTVEQRINRLEVGLQVHARKPTHRP